MFNLESKELVAETEITGLHIDTELRKGTAFPGFVRNKFQELMKNETAANKT